MSVQYIYYIYYNKFNIYKFYKFQVKVFFSDSVLFLELCTLNAELS